MSEGGDSGAQLRSGGGVEGFPPDRADEHVWRGVGTGACVTHLGTKSTCIGTGQHRAGAVVTLQSTRRMVTTEVPLPRSQTAMQVVTDHTPHSPPTRSCPSSSPHRKGSGEHSPRRQGIRDRALQGSRSGPELWSGKFSFMYHQGA